MRSYRTSLMVSVFTLGLLGAGTSMPVSAAPANGLDSVGNAASASGSANIILVGRGGGGGGGHGGGGGGGGHGGGGGGHGGGGGGHGGGGSAHHGGGGGHGGHFHGGGRGGGGVVHRGGGGGDGGNWHGGHGGHKHHHHHHARRFFPGFVAGWSYSPYWDDEYYDYPDTTVVVGAGGSGVARCEAEFRSFNRRTGTYTTYGGETKVCPYLR